MDKAFEDLGSVTRSGTSLLYILSDGRMFVHYEGDAWFFAYRNGTSGKQKVDSLPAGIVVKKTVELKMWNVEEKVHFQPGKLPLYVEVSFAAIDTAESSIFIDAMEEKTENKHPDDAELSYNEDLLLRQWVMDEVCDAVGSPDGKGLTNEQIYKRVVKRFEKLMDDYKLWTSVRGRVECWAAVGRHFIN